MTDASKDVLIAAKNKRIRDLEDENKMLKQGCKCSEVNCTSLVADC